MGYKAFEKGMICRGKQYAENTVYEEKGADNCCEAGVMHYCDEPFAVWDYYPVVDDNGNFTEYAEVEPLDEVPPLSMEFSRQEYWSDLPFPSPGDLPNPMDQTRVSCIAGRFFAI